MDIYLTYLMDGELIETEAVYDMKSALQQRNILLDDGAQSICLWSVKDGLLVTY